MLCCRKFWLDWNQESKNLAELWLGYAILSIVWVIVSQNPYPWYDNSLWLSWVHIMIFFLRVQTDCTVGIKCEAQFPKIKFSLEVIVCNYKVYEAYKSIKLILYKTICLTDMIDYHNKLFRPLQQNLTFLGPYRPIIFRNKIIM